nr:MAG: hypothetical protein [Bacteriophage sp.]
MVFAVSVVYFGIAAVVSLPAPQPPVPLFRLLLLLPLPEQKL